MGSFGSAVARFEESAEWLGDVDAPALAMLRELAAELDRGGVKGPLVSAFGLAYRSLLARAPEDGDAAPDPLAAALGAAEGK